MTPGESIGGAYFYPLDIPKRMSIPKEPTAADRGASLVKR